MKRFSTTSDSLDLLLGPMCNTFGVLVLIACITALFSQQHSDNKRTRKITATEELLQRRLRSALEESGKLKELIGDGTSALSPEQTEKLAEVERLRHVLEALQQQTAVLDKKIAKSASANAIDPGVSIGELKKQQRAAQHDIDSLKNMVAAVEEQLDHLGRRKEDLLKDKEKAIGLRTVKMRFPREHSTDLLAWQVIVRHGKIYPISFADGSSNPDVVHTPHGEDGFDVQPDPSAGWSVIGDKSKILKYLSSVNGAEFYFGIYVYPDSFEACRALKQMIMDAGMQFGIKALPKNYPLGFSKKGLPPPKPL